jgi:soluble lytic murein transglycosylase-like protein
VTPAQVAAAIAIVITPAGGRHHETYQRDAANYARQVIKEAERFNLPPFVLVALVATESHWKPDAVNPKTGAVGLGQLNVFGADDTITPTGREILAGGFEAYRDQLFDPAVNLFLTARWLRKKLDQCHQPGDPMTCALTRYGGHHAPTWARKVLELSMKMEAGEEP